MLTRLSGRSARRLLLLLPLIALVASCAVNPVTGRRELVLVSEAQEIEMGRQTAAQVDQQLGLVADEGLQQYVHSIGTAMAARSERPHLPWTFRVVDDPTPNAFALPGGFIYVTRGMMGLMMNESELAGVLGHEIGHVTARHSVSQMTRAQLAQIGLVVGQIAVPELGQVANAAGAGLQLLFLHYGRDAERQSDELGFEYSLQAGYDVREMADIFRSLQRMGSRQEQSALPTWLASHPGEEERIEAAEARVAALPAPPDSTQRGTGRYLEQLAGLVYGQNPRNGFFRDGRFYHPELRFQMDFPRGWATQNLAQAVMAGSPQQDAILQLTLAAAGGATAAAQGFLSQQGIQPVQTRRESVQGNPAVLSLFQAQTQQGVVEGIAAWIDYGGRTYQLLGYTPGGRFGAYSSLLQQTIASFRSLSDPAILNVQPDRLEVVRVEQRMTLDGFNRRYPSAIDLEELAILNQLDGSGATIPAGTLMKRIVRGDQ
jgi:predicted Zn-dependent protease